MGLLDDAIREHLDLKRRRGADPADVERAEREALGPVRRAPTSQNAEVADEHHAEAGFAYDHEDELGPEFEDETFIEPPVQPEPQQRPSRLARIFGRADPDPEPEPEPELAEPEYEEPGFEEPVVMPPPAGAPRSGDAARASRPSDPTRAPDLDDRAQAPRPDEPLDPLEDSESDRSTPPPHPAGGLGDETTEYEVEPPLHASPPAEGEDVLEETPEFLQDTPDHDRLWFEQRPPKDFDFDG